MADNETRIEISGVIGNGSFSNISAIYRNGGQIYGDEVKQYHITAEIGNGSIVGSPIILDNGITNIAIVPADGYVYPSSVTVVNAEYQYNAMIGVITLMSPSDDVSITASCRRAYSISVTLVDASAADNNPTFIVAGETATLVFHFTEPYSCPTYAPSVVGASRSWTKNSDRQGTIVLSNPTRDVSFTIAGYMPTLSAPQVYLSSADVMSITEVANAERYGIYVDGVKVATVQPNNA